MMTDPNDLYCLNTDHMLSAETSDGECADQGPIVLGGLDAAIEIKGNSVNLLMHGMATANPHFVEWVCQIHDGDEVRCRRDDDGDFVESAGEHLMRIGCQVAFKPFAGR